MRPARTWWFTFESPRRSTRLANPYELGPGDAARYQSVLRTAGRGGSACIVSAVVAAAGDSDDEAAWSLHVLEHLAWAGLSAEMELHSTASDQITATVARTGRLLQRTAGAEPGATRAARQLLHYALEAAEYDWRRAYNVWDPLTQRPTPN